MFYNLNIKAQPSYWIMSNGEINDNWYNKLSKEPEFANFLKSSKITVTQLEIGKCVSLVHKNNYADPFELRVGDCQEKKHAVCSKEKPKFVPGGNPSTFPCVTTGLKRKKRDDENEEECDQQGKRRFNMTSLEVMLAKY